MVQVQVEEWVNATAETVLGLVLDIERYAAQADKKIHPVLWHHSDGDLVWFACRPKLAGLRQPKVVQYAQWTPDHRIEIGLAPLPQNRIAHTLAEFHASLECHPTENGTRIVRTLEFRFRPAVRWLFEPLFRHRLEPEVREELHRVKQHVEHQHG